MKNAREIEQGPPRGRADYKAHVKQRVLTVAIEVDAGSPTEITIGVGESGGFLAAYGDKGPQMLGDLQRLLAAVTDDWFNRNGRDFSLT